MKYGIRKPNIKKSIKARTTGKIKRKVKKATNPFYGKKGVSYIKNPKKAIYNKIYNKTTVGSGDISGAITPNSSNKKAAKKEVRVYDSLNNPIENNAKPTGSSVTICAILRIISFVLMTIGIFALFFSLTHGIVFITISIIGWNIGGRISRQANDY